MSQVRKLLNGSKIVKAQQGYKFQLDSQDIYFTDDDLKEIDKRISALPMDYRKYLGNATTAIKNGNQSGNRAENTVTMEQLGNLGKSDTRRLEKKKGSYFESWVKPDSYFAKEAINAYLNILSSVATKSTAKKKIDNNDISLVFNPGENDTYSLSTTASGNYTAKQRVLDLLNSVNSGSDYPYDVTDWDLGWLPAWMNTLPGEDKNQAARDYIDDLWTRMSSGYNPKTNPDDENFLRNFKITYGINNPASTVTGNTSSENGENGVVKEDTPFNETGNVDYTKRKSNGAYITYQGKDGSLMANSKEGDVRPYLLGSPERLLKYGLSPDYLDSVLYKGRIYKPSEITPDTNIDLYNIMQGVITTNNSIHNPTELSQRLSELIDYTDYDVSKYGYYNPEQHFWNNQAIRKELGIKGNYGVFDVTSAYDVPEGSSIFGFYDYNTPGTQQWGFRAPFYLIVGADGKLHLDNNNSARFSGIPETISQIPNMNYNGAPGYSDWQNINGNRYGFVGTFQGAETSREPYPIYEDWNGNWYYNNSSKGLILIDPELKQKILSGYKPTASEMEKGSLGKKSNKTHSNNAYSGGGFGGGSRKEGGLIPVKPLPFKYQKGSALLTVGQNEPIQIPTELHDPLSSSVQISDAMTAEKFWNALSSAEKEEIIATGIDLGGAVASLAGPVGSVAAGVTGLGSTAMFMDAAKKRKGHLDWGDYGQAALSTLLDAVSILPWVGEAGKVAKIGSKIQKVAAPLGKIFTLMGLSAAASVVTKDPSTWTTDDLVKLSSGLQAMVNLNSGFRVGRGESRLANRISKTVEAPGPRTYGSSKYKSAVNPEQPIKLSDTEVKAVVNSEKNPDKVLRDILTGESHGVKAEDLPSDGKTLLEDFGFNVKKHRAVREKNRHLIAEELPNEKPETFSRFGYLLDPIRLRNPEIKRRAYIDEQLTHNPELAAKLAPKVTSTTVETTPREIITTRKTESPLNGSERRAYISSLARTGAANHGKWQFRTPIDEGIGESVAIEKSDLKAAQTAAELNAKYRFGEQPNPLRESAAEYMANPSKLYADAVKNDLIYSARAASKASRAGKGPTAERSSRLGAESVSNKELSDYILGKTEDTPKLTKEETIEFLNGLSEPKRKSLLKLLKSIGGNDLLDVVHYFEPRKTTDVSNKLNRGTEHVSKAVNKMKERSNNGPRQERRLKEMAANLEELRNSKDPMKTLSKLANSEKSKALANENPSEYRNALNEALREAIYTKLNGMRLDRYLNRVKTQMIKDGLQFKRGGILKFQNGTPGGGWQQKIGPWYNKVLPIFSAARLGVNLGFNHKANEYQRAAAREHSTWISPQYVGAPLDLSTEERQLQAINNERMAYRPNRTSDIVAERILNQQEEAPRLQRESAVYGAMSQKTAAHTQAEIERQNAQLQADTQVANHNSDALAASRAAVQQVNAQEALLAGKSIDNYLYEMEYGISKDQELLKKGTEWALAQRQDNEWKNFYTREAFEEFNKYNSLPPDEKLKYDDFRDYLQRVYPTKYLELREAIEEMENKQLNEKAEAQFGQTTYLPYRPVDNGPLSTYKKGGLLRGNTRYKNEPDEQIWIDSNKAVHAAVAKLQDNTIKLLLRALK